MINFKKNQLLRFNKDKIKNKNILVRVDFNVVFQKNQISEAYRIKSCKKTLDFLRSAKRIVLISHLGDSSVFLKDKNKKYSLKNILPLIEKILKIKIAFLKDLDSKPKEKFNLLENIRFFKGEKENDLRFAKKLSNLGDIFINEAFSVSHRKHASVYLLPKILKTFYGFQFEKEINILNKVLKKTKINKNNLGLILSGAKNSTKLPLICKFLKKSRIIILAGGLANTFLKAKGFNIGKSLSEEEVLEKIKKIKSSKILIPFDFSVVNFKKNQMNFNKSQIKNKFLGEIDQNDFIGDIGKESLKFFLKQIKKTKYIIWNGPLGFIENESFQRGTLEFAKALIKMKKKFILIGGGDTLAFLEKKGLIFKFKNISTGGGAMLYYLANENLPIFEN